MSSVELCGLCSAVNERYRTTFENDTALSVVIYNPVNVGHQLLMPKRHIINWKDLTAEEAKDLSDLTDEVESRLHKLFPEQPPITIRQRGKHSTEPHKHYQLFPSDAHGRLLYARAHEPSDNPIGVRYKGEWNDKTTKPVIPGTEESLLEIRQANLERFLGDIAENIRGTGNVERDRQRLREITHELLKYNGLL